jgi:hypothetical protein
MRNNNKIKAANWTGILTLIGSLLVTSGCHKKPDNSAANPADSTGQSASETSVVRTPYDLSVDRTNASGTSGINKAKSPPANQPQFTLKVAETNSIPKAP